MNTLFISDIHLNGTQPAITAQFVSFLKHQASQADALYILGDLFEFWIGDDDPDPTYAHVQSELRVLTASGVPCYVMHGNRDFLLGQAFCKRTGCQLIKEGSIIDLYGQRVLLRHGDSLCTDDIAYQRLRRILRNPITLGILQILSIKQRQQLAQRIRQESRKHTQQTTNYIMDVNHDAVRRDMENTQVKWLIHGHTHRPNIHQDVLGNNQGTRIVLGDWHQQGSVLSWSAEGYQLLTLPR